MNKKITHNPFYNRFYVKLNLIGLLLLALWLPLRAAIPHVNAASLIKVSGRIVDENNQALPGVTVHIKNSSTGVATDANGEYSISAEQGSTLIYSSVGYITQEIVVHDSNISLQLKPKANMLTEVVAIGYQSVRKSDVTGAISSVKASELNLSAPTIGQALVGKLAGVQVSQ